MKRQESSLKMTLCTFSGEDKFIVRKCSAWIKWSFAGIGFFVIIIFIGCFLSAYFFSNSLFEENQFISLPIAFIWGLLVVNMYLLLLYTISPVTLPTRKKYTASDFLSASMVFRMLFMLLLAIIIAQPLNVWMFSDNIRPSLERHILEEKTRMIIVSDSVFVKEEAEAISGFNRYITTTLTSSEQTQALLLFNELNAKITEDQKFLRVSTALLDSIDKINNIFFRDKALEIKKEEYLSQLSRITNAEVSSDKDFIMVLDNLNATGTLWSGQFEECKEKLKEAILKKIANYNELEVLLSKTNFYIKRNQLILAEAKASWLLTAIICLLFLLPIYWKFRVRKRTDYYKHKSDIEKKIVIDEYSELKQQYSKILNNIISNYNTQSKNRIFILLEKLKKIDEEKYTLFIKKVKREYDIDELVRKYEYWKDSPFRTERHQNQTVKKAERDLLKLLYPDQ